MILNLKANHIRKEEEQAKKAAERKKQKRNANNHKRPRKDKKYGYREELTVFNQYIPEKKQPPIHQPYFRIIEKHSDITFVSPSGPNGRASVFKSAIDKDTARKLAIELRTEYKKMWDWNREDRRGKRPLLASGIWAERGHCPTKGPGKLHRASTVDPKHPDQLDADLKKLLAPITKEVLKMLKACRPAEYKETSIFEKAGIEAHGKRIPLVMATEGTSFVHDDRDDYLSIMICLDCEGAGGDFCFASTNVKVDFRPGDAIVMDTDAILHGNLDFQPTIVRIEEEDGAVTLQEGRRTVLIYVIHKAVLNAAKVRVSMEETKASNFTKPI